MFLNILTPIGLCASIISVPNARNDEAEKSERRALDLLNEGERGVTPAASSFPPLFNHIDFIEFIERIGGKPI